MINPFIPLMEKYPGLRILLLIIAISTLVELSLFYIEKTFPKWVTTAVVICLVVVNVILLFIIRTQEFYCCSGAAIGATIAFVAMNGINRKNGMKEVDE